MKYLLVLTLLFFSANITKADLSKNAFKVCNESIQIDKNIFKTLAGKDCKCDNCECKDCQCKDKCECSDCYKVKSVDPLTLSKGLTLDEAYYLVKNGNKVVLWLGVKPTADDKRGNWCYIPSYLEYKKGIYDCYLENGNCLAQIRSKEIKGNSNCQNGQCVSGQETYYYYNNCSNGKCNK